LALRRIGEPLRSTFKAEEMRKLLGKHGFIVGHDDGLPEIGASLSEEVGRATRAMKHLRIAVADSIANEHA
jgi:hypothetical protein